MISHDEALDVHAHFLPTPYLEALRSAGVTTVDNGIPVPGWEVGQAIGTLHPCIASPSTSLRPRNPVPPVTNAVVMSTRHSPCLTRCTKSAFAGQRGEGTGRFAEPVAERYRKILLVWVGYH